MSESDSHPGVGQADAGPPGSTVNSGMQISGGTFLGPVAGGYGAHATQVNQVMADAERLARLERLLRELEAGVRELDGGQPDEAVQAVVLLREEVQQPRPDAGKVSQLLGRIMTRVAPVAALIDLVTQVKDLVAPLLH
jgi:hypothetical protein